MAENITDVDTFTDPIQVSVDSEFADNASLKLFIQGLANRTRNAKNRLDTIFANFGNLVIGSGADFTSLKTAMQGTQFVWSALQKFGQDSVEFSTGDEPRLVPVPLVHGILTASGATWSDTVGLRAAGASTALVPMVLRHGLTITGITAHCARNVATDSMTIALDKVTPGASAGDPNAVSVVASIVKSTTTAEVLTSAVVSEAVDPSCTYQFRCTFSQAIDQVIYAWVHCIRRNPFLGA